MNKLLLFMIKEEWRIHTIMLGTLSFALFPVMLLGISFMGAFMLPLIRSAIPNGNISLLLHSNYMLLGIMVGGFGLLGNEAMNRRFGQASLIAYATRTLPLSGRYIFTTFVVKDIIYYCILWIFPFAAGFFLASYCMKTPLIIPAILTLTLTISFLFGLSSVFFLSMVYMRSRKVMIILFGLLGSGILVYSLITGNNPVLLLLPLLLLNNFSLQNLGISLLLIVSICTLSIILFSQNDSSHSREYKNRLAHLTSLVHILPNASLVAKDLIDLYRSGSAIGQTIFSFLFPLMIIWFFLTLVSGYLPLKNLLFLFTITTGVIASTMYTWLTSFDNFQSYACLPVSIGDLITSKITAFSFLQIIPMIFLTFITVYANLAEILIPVLVLCLSISYFSLSVTIWLCGLSPTVLLYSIKVMVRYFLLIGIVSAIFSSLSFSNSYLALTSLLLFLPALILIKRGMQKWEREEQISY